MIIARPRKEQSAMLVLVRARQPQRRWVAGLLWLLALTWVARVTILIRPRAPGQFSTLDALALVQIVIVLVIPLVLLASRRLGSVWRSLRGTSVRSLAWYYGLCLVSALWSASPAYSAYRGLEFLVMLLAVCVAVSFAKDLRRAEQVVFRVALIVIVLSVAAIYKLHGFSLDLWHWHTNSYSASGMMLFCYCVGEYFRAEPERKRVLLWFGSLGLAVTVLGTSSASNVSAAVGVVVAGFLLRNKRLVVGAIAVMLIGGLLLLLTAPSSEWLIELLFPGKDQEDIVTLQGRTSFWQVMYEAFTERPVLGYGFGVLSDGRGQLSAVNTHNSVLAVLLGTGLTGLSVAVVVVYRLVREALMTTRMRLAGAVGSAAALSAGMVNSLAMPLVFSEWEESSLVFVGILALFVTFVVLPARGVGASRRFAARAKASLRDRAR